MTPDAYITVNDAARILGCSTRVIYTAINSGELRASVINGRGDRRIRPEWLSAFIDARSLAVSPERMAHAG